METSTMGKVLVAAKIENLNDLFLVSQGLKSPQDVRTVEVADALVDTGWNSPRKVDTELRGR
jgi:hypothetical protein